MIVEVNGKEAKLPDFFIVGAAKSGTTSLARYLAEHPDIYISPIKEPQFFAFYGTEYRNNKPKPFPYVKDFSEYTKLFEKANKSQVLGEASTWYSIPLTIDNTIRNIHKFYGDKVDKLKFIFIIRNPIERIISAYTMYVAMGIENLPLSEAIFKGKERVDKGFRLELNYIENMMISDSVKRFIDEFGKSKVKIYLYEDFKINPQALLEDIFRFLGVEPNFKPRNLGIKYNKSGIIKSKFHKIVYSISIKYNPFKLFIKYVLHNYFPETYEKLSHKKIEIFFKKPELDARLRKQLKEIFKEDILRLQNLINRDLSHWLKED